MMRKIAQLDETYAEAHPEVIAYYIYKFTSPEDKSYIGALKAIGVEDPIDAIRFVLGMSPTINEQDDELLNAAIVQFGYVNFEVEILGEYPIHTIETNRLYHIGVHRTWAPHGYNKDPEPITP